MSLVFFGIGFIIFSIYLILLVWNIIYNGNKQEEENYPNLDYDKFNDVDMDGSLLGVELVYPSDYDLGDFNIENLAKKYERLYEDNNNN